MTPLKNLTNDSPPKRKRGQRGPGKKNLLKMNRLTNPNQNQNELESTNLNLNPDQLENDPTPGIVETDIQANTSDNEADSLGFGARLREQLTRIVSDDNEVSQPEKRKTKGASSKEFNTLIVAFLTLGVSLSFPPQIAPEHDEIKLFSDHLSGILLRHLPISGKFSADALDLIGLLAVSTAYYARVAPAIAEMRETRRGVQPSPRAAVSDPNQSQQAQQQQARKLSATEQWLNDVEEAARRNANDSSNNN